MDNISIPVELYESYAIAMYKLELIKCVLNKEFYTSDKEKLIRMIVEESDNAQ